MLREGGKPAPAMRELPGRALWLASLVSVAGSREVMQTEQLLSLGRLRKIERLGERGRRSEELLPLEVALGTVPDRADTDRPGWPFIVVLDFEWIGIFHETGVDTKLTV